MSATVTREPRLEVGREEMLFETPNLWIVSMHPDGERFLALKRPERTPITELKVVFNWFEEIKRLAPVEED